MQCLQAEKGKAEKARKKAEAAAKKEAQHFVKETAPNPDKSAKITKSNEGFIF